MLVSLALMAVIAAGLLASLNLGIRSYDRVTQQTALQPELARRAQLRRLLATTVSLDRLSNFPLSFQGDRQSLSFITFTATPFAPEAAALQVHVMLGRDILMRVEMLDDDGAIQGEISAVLAQDVANAQLYYYDHMLSPPAWVTTWDYTAKLPVLVRITADPGSRPEWPEMTVRLQQAIVAIP